MADTLTDPAARLIKVLSKALSVQSAEPYFRLWEQVLNVKSQDYTEIYRRLDMIRGIILEVERGILLIHDIKHEVFLKHLPPLRQIISRPNLGEQWGQSRVALEIALSGLEFCSERLQATSPEILIDKDDLEYINKQVGDLIEKLKASESVPQKLRYVLFDLLEAIRRSIDEYAFRGSRGLRKELFVIMSQLQENWNLVEDNKDKEEVGTFFKILSKFDAVTASAMKVKELIGGAMPYIPVLLEKIGHVIT